MFKTPIEVLACADLDAARQILECWRQDALELQAATDEAMSGSEEPMLKRVLDAHPHPWSADRRPAAGPLSRLSLFILLSGAVDAPGDAISTPQPVSHRCILVWIDARLHRDDAAVSRRRRKKPATKW